MNMLIFGPQDLSLNAKGISQVQSTSNLLKKLLKNEESYSLITSGLKRCLETTDIISKNLDKDSHLIADKNLSERNFGNWSLYGDSISKLYNKNDLTQVKYKDVIEIVEELLPDNAETNNDFEARIVKQLAKHLFNSSFSNMPLLVVSHGCVKDVFVKYLNCDTKNLNYGSGLYFTYNNYEWSSNLLGGLNNDIES